MTRSRITCNQWEALELADLFYAYRKAKADCFFDRSTMIATECVEFEANLPKHLSQLHGVLVEGNISTLINQNVGDVVIGAKKLTSTLKKDRSNYHGFFSDPDKAFSNLCRTHDITPEFRLLGHFPIATHILSALWINLVGHKYDACLTADAYGARLRRYRPLQDAPRGSLGAYHIDSIGSFEPYFQPYKSWRANGLSAIRRELKNDRPVVALSMDFANYYHNIDPQFLTDETYLKQIGLELNSWELDFTAAIVRMIKAWGKLACEYMQSFEHHVEQPVIGGIPIGLSVSRLISNVLLIDLDKDIIRGLAPVYYGRYIDDVFLVIQDPGNIYDAHKLQNFINKRTECFPNSYSEDQMDLRLPAGYQGQTVLRLQEKKQKTFYLQGDSGQDLLDNIESQIRDVASERKLLPSPDKLEYMASARVLTAAGHGADEADALRRADGLSVRRLGWAIQLNAMETLAGDLQPSDWKVERSRFYQFSRDHILRPDKILDHMDYVGRLLSLAVSVADWSEARRLVDTVFSAIYALESATNKGAIQINGFEISVSKNRIWSSLRDRVARNCQESILRSLQWDETKGRPHRLTATARRLFHKLKLDPASRNISKRAVDLRELDWSKTPYKEHLRLHATSQRSKLEDEDLLYNCYGHADALREFLTKADANGEGSSFRRLTQRIRSNDSNKDGSLIPFLFPTRPYSTDEIALLLPSECVLGSKDFVTANWCRYVRALRGVWVLGTSDEGEEDTAPQPPLREEQNAAVIGEQNLAIEVRLGISSLSTSDEAWSGAASGTSDLSRLRYSRVANIVNHAVRAWPRPTHLLLPELSLPERWLRSVSKALGNSGISLIAGLDYVHPTSQSVYSEVVLVLSDDRLGYPSFVQIRQRKGEPAPREEKSLLVLHGKTWESKSGPKPVYNHKGFCFSILVCSELLNLSYRADLQGKIDSLLVLSWNRDLETFSSLIEAATLDLHACVAFVNNRRYGDSRVRIPAKKNYHRDLCRVRGGDNEYLLVVPIEFQRLRSFHSRAKRWPNDDDFFKPVPEGFCISRARTTTPK